MRNPFACRLLIAALAVVSFTRDARANGRFPAAYQLAPSATDPKLFVLRTTIGLLISHDTGKTWDWLCERAAGYAGGEQDPVIGVTASGAIVVGIGEGLSTSSDTGCTWGFAPGFENRVFSDIVVRPDDPATVLALESNYRSPGDGGGAEYDNQLLVTHDDGAHWALSGIPLDAHLVLETVEVAQSDPHRVYVSGFEGGGPSLRAVLLVSPDDGATWTSKPIPLDNATERAPFIAAVDPSNPARVYVRTLGADSSRLLVTDNAGDSFRSVFQGPPMLGFALSADGSKVFVGGSNGLFEASTVDLVFAQKSNIPVQCLKSIGASLYACSIDNKDSAGFFLGVSSDEGATFQPVLHMYDVRGPLACPSGSRGDACSADWPIASDTLGARTAPDGGADGGATDAPATPSDGGGGGGCSTSAKSAFPTGLAIFSLVLAVAWARRRR